MNGPPTELAPGGLEMSRRTQMRMEGVVIDTNVFVSDLTADKLLADSRLPLGWHEQRTVLGFT